VAFFSASACVSAIAAALVAGLFYFVFTVRIPFDENIAHIANLPWQGYLSKTVKTPVMALHDLHSGFRNGTWVLVTNES
jgi:hypothetical protein